MSLDGYLLVFLESSLPISRGLLYTFSNINLGVVGDDVKKKYFYGLVWPPKVSIASIVLKIVGTEKFVAD